MNNLFLWAPQKFPLLSFHLLVVNCAGVILRKWGQRLLPGTKKRAPNSLSPSFSHLLSRVWKGKSNEDAYSLRAPCLRKLWPQGQTLAPQCLDSNPGSPLQVVWVWTSYFCVSFVIYKMGMIMVCPSWRFCCCLSFDGGRCKLTCVNIVWHFQQSSALAQAPTLGCWCGSHLNNFFLESSFVGGGWTLERTLALSIHLSFSKCFSSYLAPKMREPQW